jgi:hypothetical protein
MNEKEFDKLSKRDFENGAVMDEIKEAIKKAAKWDALAKKYPHFCERFDVEIDALEKDS